MGVGGLNACFCHVSRPEDGTVFQAQGCYLQPEAAEAAGGPLQAALREPPPHRPSAWGPGQTRAWCCPSPDQHVHPKAGAWLHAKRQELRRPTPCRGDRTPREAMEGQEAADPSPRPPPQRSLRPCTKPLRAQRGSPAAPPDHQQPQTMDKWDPGPQLGRGSPSGIKKDPGVGGTVPRLEKSQHTAPGRRGRLLPACRKWLCKRRLSPGRSWSKRQPTPDLVG